MDASLKIVQIIYNLFKNVITLYGIIWLLL